MAMAEQSSVTGAAIILKRVTSITVLIACVVLLYTTSKGYFYKDDFGHLMSVRYETTEKIADLLVTAEITGHYRPLQRAFILLNYLASGLNPTSYFITGIALFFLNVLVFFFLVQTLSKSTFLACSATLLLLLQVNTYIYTVNWISATATAILLSLFFMTSILFYVRSVRDSHFSIPPYLLSLLSFIMALLSRESAVTILVVLFAYDFLFTWLNEANKIRTFGYMILRYIPFLVVFAGYLLLTNASGGIPLTGEGLYTFQFGLNILENLVFFGLQLGYLPSVIVLLSLPLMLNRQLRFEENDVEIILFGLLVALVSLLPILFLPWNSPTWLFSPAIGTTLATSVLFKKGLDEWDKKNARLVLLGVIVSAILGCTLLFWRLNEDHWLEWGTWTRNVLVETKEQYSTLPRGATIYYIDRNEGRKYGISRMFTSFIQPALQLWYDDLSLEARSVGNMNDLQEWKGEQAQRGRPVFIFEYYNGHVTDKTDEIRSRAVNSHHHEANSSLAGAPRATAVRMRSASVGGDHEGHRSRWQD